jgi:hypothetical protein
MLIALWPPFTVINGVTMTYFTSAALRIEQPLVY